MKNANPNKIALSALAVLALTSLTQTSHAANGSFGGGDGTTANTAWLIEDCIDLQAVGSGDVALVSNNLSHYYKLANDIDCSDTNNSSIWSIEGFEAIGTDAARFAGSFDGNNKTISNLYINRPSTEDLGLFGYADTGSNIFDLEVNNADITANDDAGILVGENRATISNVHTSGNLTGGTWVGGIVGYNWFVISKSSSSATVEGSDSVGGIAGTNDQSITNSYSFANVTATTNNVGGITGHNTWEITNSYAAGTASGTVSATNIGGLVGFSGSNAFVDNSFFDQQVNDCHSAVTSGCGDTQGTNTADLQNQTFLEAAGWDFTHKTGDWLFSPGINSGYALTTGQYTPAQLAESANTASSTLSAIDKERLQEILDHIQTVKGEDYNEALPTGDTESNEMLNAVREASKIAYKDQSVFDTVSYIGEVFAGLSVLPTTIQELNNEIRDWRLRDE